MPSFILQVSNEIFITTKVILNVLTFALCILACYTDLSKGRVPNWLTMPFLLFGLAINFIVGGWNEHSHICLSESIGGMFLGGIFMLLLYFVGGLGGGDVKLFAAVGALKGQKFTLESLLYACLVGGVLALFQIVFRWITYNPDKENPASTPQVQVVVPEAEDSLTIEQKKELARKKREEEQKKLNETPPSEQGSEAKPEAPLHPEDPEAQTSEPRISFSSGDENASPEKKATTAVLSEEEEKKHGIPFGFAISLGVIMTFIMKPGL